MTSTLEALMNIKHQLGLQHVTPLVLEYNNYKEQLNTNVYTPDQVQAMSIAKVRIKYMRERGYNGTYR